jgi:hypothetical protein
VSGQLFYERDDYVVSSEPRARAGEERIVQLRRSQSLWIAADSENLYWVRSGSKGADDRLETSTLSGDGIRTLAFIPLGVELAVSDGYVYWATYHGFGRVRSDGEELDRRFLRLPSTRDWGGAPFAISDNYVYFTARDFRIGRVSLNESPTPVVEWVAHAGKDSYPGSLAVGGGYVYWWSVPFGTVGRASIDDEEVDPRWSPRACRGSDGDLAYLDGFVYWKWNCASREGPEHIARMAEDGDEFNSRFRDLDYVGDFAVTSS